MLCKYLLVFAIGLSVFACKVRKDTGSDVKVDTSFDTRTGMSDDQSIELIWTEASPGTLKPDMVSGYINLYLQPMVCVVKPNAERSFKCQPILTQKDGPAQLIGSFPIAPSLKTVIPSLKSVVKGSMINQAATALHVSTGLGKPGDFFLGFKLLQKGFLPYRLYDVDVSSGVAVLEVIQPQKTIPILDPVSGAKAVVEFSKVSGAVQGIVASPFAWGPFSKVMHDFVYSGQDQLAFVSSTQQNFFAQELAINKLGYTKLIDAKVSAHADGSRSFEAVYADNEGNRCLRITHPKEAGPFTVDSKLRQEELSCHTE